MKSERPGRQQRCDSQPNGSAAAAECLVEWQRRERPQDLVEARVAGLASMYEFIQRPGLYPDPAVSAFNLQLMVKGTPAQVSFGGVTLQFDTVPGDLVLAPSHTSCSYSLDAHHHVLALVLPDSLVKSVAQERLCRFNGDFSHLHAGTFRAKKISLRIGRLWQAGGNAAKLPMIDLHTEVLAIIDELLHLSVSRTALLTPRQDLAPHARRRVIEYVEENLQADVSLPTLADVAGLSTYHFLRAFKADMGVTPHQYVIQHRVHRAARLLHGTRLSLTQIAMDCGFASQQHMSSVFKSVRGSSPKSLRFH